MGLEEQAKQLRRYCFKAKKQTFVGLSENQKIYSIGQFQSFSVLHMIIKE